jgi:hypothetical protein
MYQIRTWKQMAVLLLLFIAIFSCRKQKIKKDPTPPGTETPGVYESILNLHTVSFCGSPLISNLKIKDGTDIGTVTVVNDSFYLYLTYQLNGNWYLGDVHSYAGRELLIPKNTDGNPVYTQFPGKQDLDYCDQRQKFTFRVLLSSLTLDNDALCPTNMRYYIAMRASVKQFSSGADCNSGTEQAAWGAPFLINPGNANEWATAFYYCRQDCSATPISWCAYSQGYWFNSPTVTWCQNVKFGNLEVNRQDGIALWPAQNNWVRKAFFQGSALQLSRYCENAGNAIPASIVNDYNRVETFLSAISYTNIQNGTFPQGVDTAGVKTASGNIGRWICYNHCTANSDPTACTGY